MTRTVTVCLFSIVLVGLLLAYRHSRGTNHPLSTPISKESTEASIVLPVVSSAWSNMTSRTIVPARAGGITIAGSVEPDLSTGETNETQLTPSPELVGARAKDLMARAALETVGVDPDAEQYWMAAINDPNLPAEERQELITALEEAGFADPRRATTDDLALIASRIALLEEIAPNAMDSVNAAAFQDAYRTLLNMFTSATAALEPNTQSAAAAQ